MGLMSVCIFPEAPPENGQDYRLYISYRTIPPQSLWDRPKYRTYIGEYGA